MKEYLEIRKYLKESEVNHLVAIGLLIENLDRFLKEAKEVKCIKFSLYPEYWQNEDRYTVEIASFVIEDYNGKPIDWIVNSKLKELIAGRGLFYPLKDIGYENLVSGGEDNYLTHFDFYIDRQNIDKDFLGKSFIGKIFEDRLRVILLKDRLEKELLEKENKGIEDLGDSFSEEVREDIIDGEDSGGRRSSGGRSGRKKSKI